MKVVPAAPQPPVSVAAGKMAPTAAGISFNELLKGPDGLRQERRERAFGFSELGMLSTRDIGHAAASPPPPDIEPLNDEADPISDWLAAAAHPAARSLASRPAGARAAGIMEAAETSVRVVARPSPSLAAAPEAAPTLELPPAPETEGPIQDRATPLRQSSPPPSRPLKLAVLERDGALQLIAGSPELNADERARLRRAAAAVAAEFGLSIDSFTLNGSDDEPPAFTPIGASHGHHRG